MGWQRFPITSLWLVVPVDIGTRTLVVVTLVLGSVVIRASAVVPDIDSHDSIARRKFGRLLTGWVLVVFLLTSVDLVVPGPLLMKLSPRSPWDSLRPRCSFSCCSDPGWRRATGV